MAPELFATLRNDHMSAIDRQVATPCCNRPSIVNLDSRTYQAADGTHSLWTDDKYTMPVAVTNRLCAHCFEHWYGIDGDVKRYTRQEWDAYITKGF